MRVNYIIFATNVRVKKFGCKYGNCFLALRCARVGDSCCGVGNGAGVVWVDRWGNVKRKRECRWENIVIYFKDKLGT